jgi:hypothetical protein
VKRSLAALSLALTLGAVWLVPARADDEKKLTFDTPKEWKELPGKTGGFSPIMSFELAKAEGDADAPIIKVYHFGAGQGGTLDDNVKRWCGQFKTKDGDKFSEDKAKKESFESNGLKVTTVEIEGTYTPPAMMRGGDPKEGQKLIGAYVEGDGGPWFVKLQGPAKSVDKAKDAFVKWLKSAKLGEEKK